MVSTESMMKIKLYLYVLKLKYQDFYYFLTVVINWTDTVTVISFIKIINYTSIDF